MTPDRNATQTANTLGAQLGAAIARTTGELAQAVTVARGWKHTATPHNDGTGRSQIGGHSDPTGNAATAERRRNPAGEAHDTLTRAVTGLTVALERYDRALDAIDIKGQRRRDLGTAVDRERLAAENAGSGWCDICHARHCDGTDANRLRPVPRHLSPEGTALRYCPPCRAAYRAHDAREGPLTGNGFAEWADTRRQATPEVAG